MKVSYNSNEFIHKNVYRNIIYKRSNKYLFKGEDNYDNDVSKCTNIKLYTPFSPTPPGPYWGLTFTAVDPSSTIKLIKIGSLPEISLSTSVDNGETWTPYSIGDTIELVNEGDKVCFAASDGVVNGQFYSNISRYNFVMTGKISASGNINSLKINDYDSSINIQLASHQYSMLFDKCTILTTPPELPSINLADYCYSQMFRNCSSLINVPSLPATNLFYECYLGMFENCTSLITVPELPATTLAMNCYGTMFQGCSNLSELIVKFSIWNEFSAFGDTLSWVNGVSPTGIFKCPTALGTQDTITRGTTNCPEGWTVVNID